MPIWRVMGAKRDTGADVVERVGAESREQAARIATQRGVLIADIQELDDQEKPIAAIPGVPDYEDVASHAAELHGIGTFLRAVGVLGIAAGIGLLFVGVAGGTSGLIASGAGSLAAGVSGLMSGVALRLFSRACMMARDVARHVASKNR